MSTASLNERHQRCASWDGDGCIYELFRCECKRGCHRILRPTIAHSTDTINHPPVLSLDAFFFDPRDVYRATQISFGIFHFLRRRFYPAGPPRVRFLHDARLSYDAAVAITRATFPRERWQVSLMMKDLYGVRAFEIMNIGRYKYKCGRALSFKGVASWGVKCVNKSSFVSLNLLRGIYMCKLSAVNAKVWNIDHELQRVNN